MQLSDINPHLALWQSENYESPGEKAWYRWIKKAERLCGHDLDGNEARDGYSMDGSYAAFEVNVSPEDYAKEVADARAALSKAKGGGNV